jgi:sterol desaturase/sphingolipid hydroxylase (fatty acid hydroxylase superfamily)
MNIHSSPHDVGAASPATTGAPASAESLIRRAARWLVLPVLLGGGLLTTWTGFRSFGLAPMAAALPAVLVFGFVGVAVGERLLPYRTDWLRDRGDTRVDVVNLVVNNGIVEKLLAATLAATLAGSSDGLARVLGGSLWPHHWPLPGQLVLMAVVAEFGSYWYHYLAHTTPWMWRFHAVHHSPHRLWFLNAPRFHPVDRLISNLPEMLPFVVLGTNAETIALFYTYNAIVGLLQHGNIDLRLGPLNYVFSLAELHRWHHSKKIEESDTNFGSNLIIWDLVFGTFFHPRDREVGEIGLLNPDYPGSYIGQFVAPFAAGDLSKPAGRAEL